MTDETQNTGPITLDDVRAAIGDTDPSTTNASKLRAAVGRGSFATIQKHLDAIRAERAPAPAVAPGTAPAAPQEAVQVLWSAAYCAAQANVLGRLEAVTAERDAARTLAATQAQDVEALSVQIDDMATAGAAAAAEAATATAALTAGQTAADTAAAAAEAATAAMQAVIDKVTAAAAAAAELAKRDAQIAAAAMQATIDRMTDQVAELKSLLHKSA